MYDVQKSFQAASVEEALMLMSQNPGAVIVCGGTDVMIRMKERKLRDAILISILNIPQLCGVQKDENGDLLIGPGTCFDDIYRSECVRKTVPCLAEACNMVGSPQIRHIATIGGNICNGAVSADSVPALLALNAELTLTSLDNERIVPITQFHTGPGKTVLRQGHEILTCIRIRRENYEEHGGCYLKFGQRNAMEISTLGCAVNCSMKEDGTIADFCLAYGVAAPRPIRCFKTEAFAVGKRPSKSFFSALRETALEETQPRDSWRASRELREQLIRELTERAARKAIFAAGGVIDGESHSCEC